MFPPVFKTLSTTAVTAIVGTRIGRHGEVAQDEVRPYIVWQIVTGQPYDNLSAAPCGDFTVVQIDCYHQTDAGVVQLATAVRAAGSPLGILQPREMERAGIEPATSALQRRRSPS